MTDKEILLKAIELIRKPENWVQGRYAGHRENDQTMDEEISPTDPKANCFCVFGAIRKIASDAGFVYASSIYLESAIAEKYRNRYSGENLVNFNDSHSHALVIQRLEEFAGKL